MQSALLRLQPDYGENLSPCAWRGSGLEWTQQSHLVGRRANWGGRGRLLSRSVASNSETPWTVTHQAYLSFTISWSLHKLRSIESVMPSNRLILCRPFLFLPSLFPSISVFSNDPDLCIRWPKYWSFSIRPSNEYLGLISFRIDWFYLLAVQGTLKSLLQHYSSKASVL